MMLYYWWFFLERWIGALWHRLRAKRGHCRRKHASPVKGFRAAPPRRSGGRPKPRWVIDEVLRRYAETGSYRSAMNAFNRQYAHAGMRVCLNTVYTWVQKYCSEMERVRRATRNRFPRFAPANLRWCLDGTGKCDAQGENHFILGILDHGSRLNLVLKHLKHGTAKAILQEVAIAIEQYGKPRFLRTDNAQVFHSIAFAQGLAQLGIRHEFTQPGKPWQNGRIERLFLSLKQKLNKIVPEDGAELDRLLSVFRCWYNKVRPHQHLHGYTPAEVWRGIHPYRNAPREVLRFVGWDGLLTGLYLRR